MSGYIKFWRKFRQHPFWLKPRTFSEAEAWIYMLMEANWEDKVIDARDVERGSFPTSIRKLSEQWQWSKDRVQRFLELLETRTMIRTETRTVTRLGQGRAYTHITIVNYERYHGVDAADGDEQGQSQGRKQGRDQGRKSSENKDSYKKKEYKKEETNKEEAAHLILPQSIDTFEVRSALQRWLSHKAEKRQSYKTTGLHALVAKLSKLPPERIVAAIDHSISQNYSGIYEASGNGASRPRTTFEKSSAAIAEAFDRAERVEQASKEAIGFISQLFIESPEVKS